jgi:predicted  nucleic acid-binding Zn-ribbon protein
MKRNHPVKKPARMNPKKPTEKTSSDLQKVVEILNLIAKDTRFSRQEGSSLNALSSIWESDKKTWEREITSLKTELSRLSQRLAYMQDPGRVDSLAGKLKQAEQDLAGKEAKLRSWATEKKGLDYRLSLVNSVILAALSTILVFLPLFIGYMVGVSR